MLDFGKYSFFITSLNTAVSVSRYFTWRYTAQLQLDPLAWHFACGSIHSVATRRTEPRDQFDQSLSIVHIPREILSLAAEPPKNNCSVRPPAAVNAKPKHGVLTANDTTASRLSLLTYPTDDSVLSPQN